LRYDCYYKRVLQNVPSRRSYDLPDPAGKDRGVDLASCLFQCLEGCDHAKHRAEEPQKRSKTTDYLQGSQPTSQGLDLVAAQARQDRKSTRLNSSHVKNSYAVFFL